MSQIFSTQTLLKLKLDCGANVSTATEKKIAWRDPDGNTGEWDVSSLDGTDILVRDMLDTDVVIPGTWYLQAKVVIGGLTGYGQIVAQKFTQILNPIVS